MILQALYELAQEEELMDDPDYEMKPIAWLVQVDPSGRLLGIVGTHQIPEEERQRKKPRSRPKSYLVPREPGRTSGDRACFLFDKAEYVFGIDPDGGRSQDKLATRSALFHQRVKECAEASQDEGALAVLELLSQVQSGDERVALPEECVSNDLFAFVYSPDVDLLVTSRAEVRRYWKNLRDTDSSDVEVNMRCLVSGNMAEPVDKHPVVKNVPGGTSSGVSLVSFNARAFESYGLKGNENAPVSRDAAEACATALNRLLHPAFPKPDGTSMPRRNLRLSAGTAVCYWARGPGSEEFLTCLGPLLEAQPDQVKELYRSLWYGHLPEIRDASAFYALTLSGAQGRATVQDWFETTVREVAVNLARHFQDVALVRNTPKPKDREYPPQIPMRVLLESLAPLGKADSIPTRLASQFFSAALRGTPYPFSVLQRALVRMRAEIGRKDWADLQRRDARAALIKAVLNRRKRFYPDTTSYKEINKDMDPSNASPGYLLGRLMAVIERMQQTALGDIGATVVDRYFSGASATPQATFPRLLKNLRHHASKALNDEAKKGTARWLESQVDGIMHELEGFPPSLDLEQQGLFVLGYHHQRHWLWMSKEEREKADTEAATASS